MSRVRFYQVVSILISLFLLHLPLPTFLLWFRPDWVLLNIIFWTTFSERPLPFWVISALGIALDAFYGTTLAAHAVGYLCVSFFGFFLKTRLTLYSLMHALTFVTILATFNQIILSICLAAVSEQPIIFYWGPIPTTLIAWPIWGAQLQKLDLRLKK
jgi:rod shape-determining protein MreD